MVKHDTAGRPHVYGGAAQRAKGIRMMDQTETRDVLVSSDQPRPWR